MAAQLVSLIKSSSPESTDSRVKVRYLSLLDVFGSAEQLPILRELIFDPLESYHVRVNALRVAKRFGLALPSHEFIQLGQQTTHQDASELSLSMLFDFAKLESFDDLMKEALLRLSPEERSRLLGFPFDVPQPLEMETWLFEHWHQFDRHLMEAPDAGDSEDVTINTRVALVHWGRPEAWQLLREWSKGLSDERLRALLKRLSWAGCEVVAQLARTSSAIHHEAAEGLLLPFNELLAHWGEEGLLHRLDRVVQAAHVPHIAPRGIVEPPMFFSRAVELLGEWEVARHRVLYRHLCDFGMALDVRLILYEQLRKHEPAAAARWALVALRYPQNMELLRRVLAHFMVQPPTAEDQPVLQAALRATDPLVQLPALAGLLTLGESGPGWVDRLQTLSNAEIHGLRLLAIAGLLRSGQRERRDAFWRLFIDESDMKIRNAALRCLAGLNAEDKRALWLNGFAKVPATPGGTPPRSKNGRAPKSAFEALSWSGDEKHLSRLLGLRLKGVIRQAFDDHFRHHLARQEGEPVAPWPPRKTSERWCETCLLYE
ncbi:hypothetical protein KRR26_19435 [Corallococcus sp. M34]|uniref:hypothetical protein n=1 Tax=Citreicoccus inhibens TaxID=2849499 RepID=UPI001C23B769|nr:hypothetical protein [Citreicoccus inhibens]MBU8897793.1 hypothetical protein [Citreicoccus inhibens]